MSFKEKIIQKVLKDEKEKFLARLIQDPSESLRIVLAQYDIQFEKKGDQFKIPINQEEEIIITVKKQKQ